MSTARGWRRKQTQDRDETRVIDKIRAKKGEGKKKRESRTEEEKIIKLEENRLPVITHFKVVMEVKQD